MCETQNPVTRPPATGFRLRLFGQRLSLARSRRGEPDQQGELTRDHRQPEGKRQAQRRWQAQVEADHQHRGGGAHLDARENLGERVEDRQAPDEDR